MHNPNQGESHEVSTTQRAELCNLHLIVFDCSKMWLAAPPQNCSPTTKTQRWFRLPCPQWAATARSGGVMLATAGKAASWQLHSVALNSALIIPPSFRARLPLSSCLQIYKLQYCKSSDVCQSVCECCHGVITGSFFFTIVWWLRVLSLFLQSQRFKTPNVFEASSSRAALRNTDITISSYYYNTVIIVII